MYLYASNATHLTGEQTCATAGGHVAKDEFDMNLGRGWNLVKVTVVHDAVRFESVPFGLVDWQ